VDKATQPSSARRIFLKRLGLFLASLASAEFVWLGYRSLKWKGRAARSQELADVVIAGELSTFSPGSVTPFPKGKFYLVCLEDGGLLALSRSCTHLHCSVPWHEEKQQFICPCHGSVFDLRGDVVRPPAPRALDLLHVRIENGIVKVDTGKISKRAEFDPVQAVRA